MIHTVDTCWQSFAAQFTSVILWYPWRDFSKFSTFGTGLHQADQYFVIGRWKGMITHPTQPALLALPTTSLFTFYRFTLDCTSSVSLAAFVGSTAHAVAKNAVSHYARRLGGTTNSRGAGGIKMFKSGWDCVKVSTKNHGVFCWLPGFVAVSLAHWIWFGMTIRQLARMPRQSFTEDVYYSLRLHMFFGFLSAPIRNATRTAMAVKDHRRFDTPAGLMSYEIGVLKEGMIVGKRMLMERGPQYLFAGCLKSIPKNSLPWAFMFASFRLLGGEIRPYA